MNSLSKFAPFVLVTVMLPGLASAQNAPAAGQSQTPAAAGTPRPSGPLQQKLAPGLANYTDQILFGEIWPGAELSPRDRSLAVISALIAMNRPAQLQGHLTRALNNGVTPLEASGVLTHLAIYAGWPNTAESWSCTGAVARCRLAARPAASSSAPAPARGASGLCC